MHTFLDLDGGGPLDFHRAGHLTSLRTGERGGGGEREWKEKGRMGGGRNFNK